MSKAFTKESDGEEKDDSAAASSLEKALPAGTKNYITPGGAAKLQAELRKLKYEERPTVVDTVAWAASNGDRSENADYTYGKRRLRQIDRKIEFLFKRLEAAEVVDPAKVSSDQIRFGATVTIRNENDALKTYSIVGVDEVDVTLGRISWRSPLANALLKGRVGDCVTFESPKGEQQVEIVEIKYVSIG